MTNRRLRPIASPSRRSTRAQIEWNVPAWTSRPGSPTSRMIRSRSSPAARFVNVTARIERRDALHADEVRDPMRQDPGLAGARSREDQHGTLGRRDRPGLLGVQPLEDLLRPGEPSSASRVAACSASSCVRSSAVSSGGWSPGSGASRSHSGSAGAALGRGGEARRTPFRSIPGRRRAGCRRLPAARGTHPFIVGRGPAPGLCSATSRA